MNVYRVKFFDPVEWKWRVLLVAHDSIEKAEAVVRERESVGDIPYRTNQEPKDSLSIELEFAIKPGDYLDPDDLRTRSC